MATIFALSSGAPPAAIAIVRVSGPEARSTVVALAGVLPGPRRARRCTLRGADGELLDDGLVLWFPGPASATGEDVAEFHIHGGRAVVAAMEGSLAALPGLRRAEPGEFTRRAFGNGRIDLGEAEGLADLLSAETELQRRAALISAGGQLSRRIESWRADVLGLSAQVEAALDFADEDDGATVLPASLAPGVASLLGEIEQMLAAPSAETLREGFRVALAGPPNAGKSTLFNALVGTEAAITTPIAGTTRDALVRSVALAGLPFSFVDMAGLRDSSPDPVELLGIARARHEIAQADVVLWLGAEDEAPPGSWIIDARCDLADRTAKMSACFSVSALTGAGMENLIAGLVQAARRALPRPGEAALSRRQRLHLAAARAGLENVQAEHDPLLIAEGLRNTRGSFDALLGRTATDEVLDTLFARFCIGK